MDYECLVCRTQFKVLPGTGSLGGPLGDSVCQSGKLCYGHLLDLGSFAKGIVRIRMLDSLALLVARGLCSYPRTDRA